MVRGEEGGWDDMYGGRCREEARKIYMLWGGRGGVVEKKKNE